MHERRVFVDLSGVSTAACGSETGISAEDAHHLKDVLRLTEGAVITVVCRATGQTYEAILSSLTPQVRLKLVSRLEPGSGQTALQTMAVALLKGDRNDLACEQLTQFGVKRIIFWQAQRSVARIKNEQDAGRRTERWQRICEASAKQSGQNFIPGVEYASSLEELLHRIKNLSGPGDIRLFCSLLPQARTFRDFSTEAANVHMLIGPEGDFSPQEEQILLKQGLHPLSLGSFRFRSETAAVAAAAMASLWWGRK